ncbi:hypothetical protein MTO96_042307, partial [Rhipicephalus appendiculatus]
MKATIEDGIVYSPHPKVDIPECSVYMALKEFLTATPERVALVDEKMCLTRGEFFSHLRKFAAGFQAHGIGLASPSRGASVLLSNPILNENDLLFQVDYADATHILTTPQYATKVTAVKQKTNVKGLFVVGDSVPGFVSVSAFAELNDDDFKEAMEISHYTLVANMYITRTIVSYGPEDVLLAWYPITYSPGLIFIAVAAATGATSVVVQSGLTFDQFVYYVKKYN